MTKEADARVKIDALLKQAGWRFSDNEQGKKNIILENTIHFEQSNKKGAADYVLLDDDGKPLVVIEAKKAQKNPLNGKEQARRYAQNAQARFVILSNGDTHYLWDIQSGNPLLIQAFPTLMFLKYQTDFNPHYQHLIDEIVEADYIALSQQPHFKKDPQYRNPQTRQAYIFENKLRFLRPYQLNAIHALQKQAKNQDHRFLFEMATGTGKTLTTAAVIKLFLKTGNAKRVLFLVDRIELENQAEKSLDNSLKQDYVTVIYKHNKSDWRKADIVVTTVQSLSTNDRYRSEFKPNDFDLIISDEAHRSINGTARCVFDYFIGFKLGLTATPKDYLKHARVDLNDPREWERRLLLDTYQTFGCEQGEPTFRYSLIDGAQDGYLINPLVVDARTEVTTRLLSEQGYAIRQMTVEQDSEDIFTAKDFEKQFFSEPTNRIFCETFLTHALRDPLSGEIGKTIVFCVSQAHTSKIAQLLNEIAMQRYPGRYQSDFALQVTSDIPDAQKMASDFAYNHLRGHSQFLVGYKTAKTRVCVTVGMMTTGYDCADLLNVGFMRPIFSPTDFVQMKGRGTRTFTFEYQDIHKRVHTVKKQHFKLFDFFANCEYFEERFNYDEVLQLPQRCHSNSVREDESDYANKVTIHTPDPLKTLVETAIGAEGMKVDRQLFQQAQKTIAADAEIKAAVAQAQWDEAIQKVRDKYENQPDLYLTLEKIQASEQVDHEMTWREVLERIFEITDHFLSRAEKLDRDMAQFIEKHHPDAAYLPLIRRFVQVYLDDERFRTIIDTKEYSELYTYASFTVADWKALGDYRQVVQEYVKNHILLNCN